MILHDVPYRGIFHVESEGWFQKGALTWGEKRKGFIGDGDYFCYCHPIEGNPDCVHNVLLTCQIWIGCDQEVTLFNPAKSGEIPTE